MSDIVSISVVILGAILVLVEFNVPGFGVMGIIGFICITLGVGLWSNSVIGAMSTLGGVILFITVFMVVINCIFHKKSAIILSNVEDPKEGYKAPRIKEDLVGKKGIALTDLHPVGCAKIEGEKVDVVTNGEYIAKEEEVEVVSIIGAKILVKNID